MQGFRSVGVCLVPDGGPHAIQFRSFLALAVMVVRPFSDVPDDEATAALLDKLAGLVSLVLISHVSPPLLSCETSITPNPSQ